MFSINTQAIVDGKLLFLDVVTGFLGSTHDAHVLRHIAIHNNGNGVEINYKFYCKSYKNYRKFVGENINSLKWFLSTKHWLLKLDH